MSRRLYLGRIPPDARSEDVEKMFDGYGRVVDCRVMTGFGFVEFETSKDAEEAVHAFNGKSFMGANIVVEFAKESRPRRDVHEGHGAPRTRRPPGVRLIVSGLSRDTSWQDLKDFGRDAGSVSFADVDRDTPGQGVLEYLSREDAERAVKELDGRDLRGKPVRVSLDDHTIKRSGPDNYRRDDRRRDSRYDDRYNRDDRGSRRDRSRSPPRRSEYDERRRYSPPRRDDDRKQSDYDDRRKDDDRRRDDDKRRDDRRRDEKDDRHEDRSQRHANGDSGWSR